MLINESPTIYAFGGDFSLYQISMPFAKGLWISMPKSPGGIPGPASFRSSDSKALYRLAELRGDVIRLQSFHQTDHQGVAQKAARPRQILAVVIKAARSAAVEIHRLPGAEALHHGRQLRNGRASGRHNDQLMVGGQAQRAAGTAARQYLRIAEAFRLRINRRNAILQQPWSCLYGSVHAAVPIAGFELGAGQQLRQHIGIEGDDRLFVAGALVEHLPSIEQVAVGIFDAGIGIGIKESSVDGENRPSALRHRRQLFGAARLASGDSHLQVDAGVHQRHCRRLDGEASACRLDRLAFDDDRLSRHAEGASRHERQPELLAVQRQGHGISRHKPFRPDAELLAQKGKGHVSSPVFQKGSSIQGGLLPVCDGFFVANRQDSLAAVPHDFGRPFACVPGHAYSGQLLERAERHERRVGVRVSVCFLRRLSRNGSQRQAWKQRCCRQQQHSPRFSACR
ncbi:hypothetical protein BN871_IM_00020 [Paenibacillus sp. P22]|nr:hypothetical protein BN871_IM_00020 [Paenibacillus sp. P22]